MIEKLNQGDYSDERMRNKDHELRDIEKFLGKFPSEDLPIEIQSNHSSLFQVSTDKNETVLFLFVNSLYVIHAFMLHTSTNHMKG
jgi:hypothetical protein